MNQKLTPRQLDFLTVLCLMSPLIRLVPGSCARLGGRAAWVGVLVAAVPSVLYCLMLGRLKGGLGDVMRSSLGKFGKPLLWLMWLWLIFYCGVIVRSGSERLLSAVYEDGSVAIFMLITLASAVFIAFGSITTLGRMGEALLPVMLVTVGASVLLALPDIKPDSLFPVTVLDLPEMLLSSLPVIDVCAGSFWFAFLECGDGEKRRFRVPIMLVLSSLAVVTATVGALSPELASRVQNPFFIMMRSVSIAGILERIEAVVVALWVVTDTVYAAGLLSIGGRVYASASGKQCPKPVIVLFAAASFACGLIGDGFTHQRISEYVVPAVNLALALVPVPILMRGKK